MADKAVIYKKTAPTDRRVPIAKVPDDEAVEFARSDAIASAIRKANTDLGLTGGALDPYGTPADRYDQAAEISKVLHLQPSLYDQRYGPKVKRSVVPIVLGSLAKSDDPRAIAKLLNDHPELYDAMAGW